MLVTDGLSGGAVESVETVEPGAPEDCIDSRSGHAQVKREVQWTSSGLSPEFAGESDLLKTCCSRRTMRPARAVEKTCRSFRVEAAQPLVAGRSRDAHALAGVSDGVALLKDSEDELPSPDGTERSVRMRHRGLLRLLAWTPSADSESPLPVNNLPEYNT
jgi:hypothetical protein